MTTLPLTTLTALKAELSIGDGNQDSYLESLILRASARLESLCNGVRFGLRDRVVDHVVGHSHKTLLLEHGPVTSVASVELNSYTVDADDYEIVDERELRHITGVWKDTSGVAQTTSRRVDSGMKYKYKVTYSAGYVTPQMVADSPEPKPARTLPYDIEEAVLALAVQAYRDKGVNQRVVKQEIMDAKVTYQSGGAALPACVSAVVSRYGRWS